MAYGYMAIYSTWTSQNQTRKNEKHIRGVLKIVPVIANEVKQSFAMCVNVEIASVVPPSQ